MSRACMWEPIIDRMRLKLASWKGGLLSLGGRATLIKASLSCLPVYYMSLFPAPMGVIEKIRRIQRQFFWGGDSEKRKLAPIAWQNIEAPTRLGGLNLGSPRQKKPSSPSQMGLEITRKLRLAME